MSGLSGFWTVYLKKTARKPRKIWTVLSGLSKKNLSKTVQDLRGFWEVYLEKPLKNRSKFARFLSFFLDKPFKNRSNRSFWSKILSAIV